MKLNYNCHKNYKAKKRRLKVQVLNKLRGKTDVCQENTKKQSYGKKFPLNSRLPAANYFLMIDAGYTGDEFILRLW